MDSKRWIPAITLAACWYNAGTIWMTHLNWRLWRYVGREEFDSYHRAWWFGLGGIKPVIFPVAALAAIGSFAQLRGSSRQAYAHTVRLAACLQVLTYGLTAILWGPWQGRLKEVRREDGSLAPFYEKILRTHWLRVALITLSGILQFNIAMRAMAQGPEVPAETRR